MSYTMTLGEILSLAKQYAYGSSDEPAYPTSDTDWYRIMNAVWRSKVFPRLLAKGGDQYYYYVATAYLTANQSEYVVGDTSWITYKQLHRIKRLSVVWSNTDKEEVRPIMERERNIISSASWARHGAKRYSWHRGYAANEYKDIIELVPTPTSAELVEIVFIPNAYNTITGAATSILSTGTLPFSFTSEGVDEVLALETARRVLMAQKEDVTEIRNLLAEAYEAMDEAVSRKNQDEHQRVIDIEPEWGELDEYYREPRA